MLHTLSVIFRLLWSTPFYGSKILRAAYAGREEDPLYDEVPRVWCNLLLEASDTPVTVDGAEQFAGPGPWIIVSNHASAYDILALATAIPVRYRFVGKKELNRLPIFGKAWQAAGHVSIDRSNRRASIESMNEAGRRIREEGSAMVIFPEGTRSRSPQMRPFKKGAFVLSSKHRIPLVPTAIFNTREIIRGGRIHPAPIHVRFGDPIHPGDEAPEELLHTTRETILAMLDDPPRLPQ
jgi:1-acyl-sn-glycerol-3-phosphate acyltransferase